MKGNQIRLTEQDLHMLVEDAVINILKENGMEEGALWNAFKNKGAEIGRNVMNRAQKFGQNAINKTQQFGQGAANVGRNMRNTYNAGRQDEKLRKYAQNAINALNQLEQVAAQFNPYLTNAIKNCKGAIDVAVEGSSANVQNVSQNTFSTQNPNQA